MLENRVFGQAEGGEFLIRVIQTKASAVATQLYTE